MQYKTYNDINLILWKYPFSEIKINIPPPQCPAVINDCSPIKYANVTFRTIPRSCQEKNILFYNIICNTCIYSNDGISL